MDVAEVEEVGVEGDVEVAAEEHEAVEGRAAAT